VQGVRTVLVQHFISTHWSARSAGTWFWLGSVHLPYSKLLKLQFMHHLLLFSVSLLLIMVDNFCSRHMLSWEQMNWRDFTWAAESGASIPWSRFYSIPKFFPSV